MARPMKSCYGKTAFVLSIFSVVCCIISFVVPHWLASWEQKQSTFTRIGLWEVCFTAFTDPKMYEYKYYSGCWWIFHSELDAIRDMLNPDWFKAVQSFATFTLFASFFTFFLLLAGRCNKSFRVYLNGGAAALSIITVLTSAISVIVFGACAKDPQQYRLPMPQYNYFGSGFGLMILCSLAAGFCFAFVCGDMSMDEDEMKERNEKYRQ